MSCSPGHSEWVSTATEACFVTVRGRFEMCVCPISTCARGSDGYYACQFTTFARILLTLLIAALAAAAGAYLLWRRSVRDSEDTTAAAFDWKLYSDRMFGVYHANDGHEGEGGEGGASPLAPKSAPAPSEATSLVAAAGGAKTSGGTF